MKGILVLILGMMVSIAAPLRAQSAEQIMERARIGATLQNSDLHGVIRKGRSKTPVALYLRNQDLQFTFTSKAGPQRFHMRLGDEKQDLLEIVNGRTVRFSREKLGQPIAGSDLTYEDLSLRFFYWPNPILEGEERVDVHNCWKIRLNNPNRSGRYGVMYVWIHQKFGAFMKIEGFDRTGAKLKEFSVRDTMKLPDKTYTVKKVEVATYEGGRRKGISYLEFDKPQKVRPKGLKD